MKCIQITLISPKPRKNMTFSDLAFLVKMLLRQVNQMLNRGHSLRMCSTHTQRPIETDVSINPSSPECETIHDETSLGFQLPLWFECMVADGKSMLLVCFRTLTAQRLKPLMCSLNWDSYFNLNATMFNMHLAHIKSTSPFQMTHEFNLSS